MVSFCQVTSSYLYLHVLAEFFYVHYLFFNFFSSCHAVDKHCKLSRHNWTIFLFLKATGSHLGNISTKFL